MAFDSDMKSLMSLSLRSEGSTTQVARTRWRNGALHERCTMPDMVKIKEEFQKAYRNKLLPEEFRTMLRTLLNIEYDDEEFKILFLKINTNRDGEVCWDELVSHLLLGYFGNDPENWSASLQPPIVGLPAVQRSHHRHPISRICFCPDVARDRSTDPTQGRYVTVSRDGMINWWSLDLTLLRSAFSTNPHLKVRTTWVTDMVCMPDVNMVVTSSTERDLRFYDCTAGAFTFRMHITSWEYMICTMNYHFDKDESEKCKLICGDAGGYVRVLMFSPVNRGPFQNRPGHALVQLRHVDLQRRPRLVPELQLVELPRAHSDWVRQTAWYAALRCVLTCATSPDALRLCDIAGSKTNNLFRVEKGVECFAFDEEAHVVVSGGPDGAVRVWSAFLPARASVVLAGHRAGVLALALQNRAQTVYSLSRDRVIKVWDVQAQTCIQTYIDIPSEVCGRAGVAALYQAGWRTLVLGAWRLAALALDERLDARHSDGRSHARAVSLLLYNPLYHVLVSCGQDSIIINWDLATGRRNVLVPLAHTRALLGQRVPVEITAGCFGRAHQLLLTGARDGTLKVWNYNTGVCLRILAIEHMCEVSSCFWVEGRILAVGWNRHVTEFEDSDTATLGKSWETRHSDDVLAAAVSGSEALATLSYNSELILWKLETGQPYRRFSCTDPMLRIKMQQRQRAAAPGRPSVAASARAQPGLHRPSSGGSRQNLIAAAAAVAKAQARRAPAAPQPPAPRRMRPLAAHACVFLATRPCHMRVASLMVSLENGHIQGWSEHAAGGFQGAFRAIHTTGHYASALATDDLNQYLFTGTTAGYIKVWLMTNYLTTEKEHISMPRLRLEFPFLWRDRIPGRAKRCVRDQPLPLLLNSYRAHLRCVTAAAYVQHRKLLLSGSADCSVRVWRLSGEYLQTLGSYLPWTLDVTRCPPDVLKVASSTTLKVWHGGQVPRAATRDAAEEWPGEDAAAAAAGGGDDAAGPGPAALAARLELPSRPERQPPIQLDDTLRTIPLYAHLRLAATLPVRRPRTPELVRAARLRPAARKAHFRRN